MNMKKIIFTITALLMFHGYSQEFILDGSFETQAGNPDTGGTLPPTTNATPADEIRRPWYAQGNNVVLFYNEANPAGDGFAQSGHGFANMGGNANSMTLRQDFTVQANTSYTVSYWVRQTTLNSDPTLRLKVSARIQNPGTMATGAALILGPNAGETGLSYQYTAPDTTTWTKETFSFNSGDNTAVLLYFSRPGGGPVTRIDNVSVVPTTSLSISELEDISVGFYPNPFKTSLSVTAAKTINTISLFNINGQMVMNEDIYATQASINIKDLSSGIYIAKVNFEDSEKSYKLIKE